MSSSSSAVQSRLNSQSVSAINPDYYIDQNRGKQNLYEIDHITLNGGTLVLSRDLLHMRTLSATVTDTTTIRLPSPELCMGVEFQIIVLTAAAVPMRISTANNASISGSLSNQILGCVISGGVPVTIANSGGVQKTFLTTSIDPSGTVLRIRSLGIHWFIDGTCPNGAIFS
jgi:hypothetical protein